MIRKTHTLAASTDLKGNHEGAKGTTTARRLPRRDTSHGPGVGWGCPHVERARHGQDGSQTLVAVLLCTLPALAQPHIFALVDADIDPFFEHVEVGLKKASEADKSDLLRLQEVLSHLELIAYKISGLAEPIRRKGNHGAILSDKDFFHINDLFSQQTGFMRALVDIFQHDDATLKAYVLHESQKLRDTCFRNEVEHETRMMDSPGQPDAWSIYIAILDHSGISWDISWTL